MAADDNQGRDPQHRAAAPDGPFTLRIITVSGDSYYEIGSESLGKLQPVTEDMKRLVTGNLQMQHIPYPQARAMEVARLCGTFIVNLSYFAKDRT